MCLYSFLECFDPDTYIRILEEDGHILIENIVGEITQRLMNQRIILSAYLDKNQLIILTARDEA